MICVTILGWVNKFFSSPKCPVFCSRDSRGFLLPQSIKWRRHEADHSAPSSTGVKNERSNISISTLYDMMEWTGTAVHFIFTFISLKICTTAIFKVTDTDILYTMCQNVYNQSLYQSVKVIKQKHKENFCKPTISLFYILPKHCPQKSCTFFQHLKIRNFKIPN